METISTAVSIIWAVLFIASTVVNIFVTMKLSKFETSIKESFNTMMHSAKQEMRALIKDEISDLRDEFRREIDKIEKRINN